MTQCQYPKHIRRTEGSYIHSVRAIVPCQTEQCTRGQVCIKVLEIIMAQKTFLRGCLVRDGSGCSIVVTAILQ